MPEEAKNLILNRVFPKWWRHTAHCTFCVPIGRSMRRYPPHQNFLNFVRLFYRPHSEGYGKVMFLHLSVRSQGVPKGLWSQVHSLVSGPWSSLGSVTGQVPLSQLGVPLFWPQGTLYWLGVPLSWTGPATGLGQPPYLGQDQWQDWGTPPRRDLGQDFGPENKCLLHSGWYNSCGYVAGPSCFLEIFARSYVGPPGGVPKSGYPPPPRGGGYLTRVGQQKEYSLHGGRYASCVHAGGLSCFLEIFARSYVGTSTFAEWLYSAENLNPLVNYHHFYSIFSSFWIFSELQWSRISSPTCVGGGAKKTTTKELHKIKEILVGIGNPPRTFIQFDDDVMWSAHILDLFQTVE